MALSTQDFDFIRGLIQRASAIVLESEKTYLVETRLLPVARREGLTSVGELIQRLRGSPDNGLHRKVVEAMTTNETSFFRDLFPFEALKDVVLPDLLKRRAPIRRLSIWCAASSTGQEPYSIALVLKEKFPQLLSWNIRLLATDLSTGVLEKARQANYSQLEVNRGMRASMLLRNFHRRGPDWQLADDVRRMVEFRQMNLIDSWPTMPPLDIVFLRNVLIYFDVATKREILNKVRKVLLPDGYLFLGGAETTLNLDENFERVPVERSGCYRLRQG